MSAITTFIIATFTVPENIGASPLAILWLLPLTAAIVIVYKATKVPKITAGSFIKEISLLFGSIIVFILMIAVALYALAWLITES